MDMRITIKDLLSHKFPMDEELQEMIKEGYPSVPPRIIIEEILGE